MIDTWKSLRCMYIFEFTLLMIVAPFFARVRKELFEAFRKA